jgi:hypothetical protein
MCQIVDQYLQRARKDLLWQQERVQNMRALGYDVTFDNANCVRCFYAALDRAWEAQCMAQAQL